MPQDEKIGVTTATKFEFDDLRTRYQKLIEKRVNHNDFVEHLLKIYKERVKFEEKLKHYIEKKKITKSPEEFLDILLDLYEKNEM
ncbi:MAG: hypothetical protein ACFFCS_11270 [Candidatus Hodarchaeota archaeon]